MKTKATASAAKVQIKEKTNAQKTLRRFFSRKIAVAGMIILCSIILLAVFGDFICPHDPAKINPRARFASPSAEHIMGADDLGRDTFARIIDGARLTLIIAGGSVAISLLIGTALGLIAGYKQGWLDTVLSGLMDSLWAFPAIVLAMAISAALGSSIQNIIIAIGVVNIPDFFRIVRSRVITIREMEYVTGARAIGLRDGKIIWRYILPNLLSTLIVQATLTASKAVLAEAGLSFMGLGVTLPRAPWGAMLKTGYGLMRRTLWLSIFPGAFIMLLVMSLNFVGDGLRDALDIRIRAD
ncbi:MAG: ABC transporter permease [Clostridia bacterium]|nr:ABC transporter permease [Clostridia bacterium]